MDQVTTMSSLIPSCIELELVLGFDKNECTTILTHLISSSSPHLSEYGGIGRASTEASSNKSLTLTLLYCRRVFFGGKCALLN